MEHTIAAVFDRRIQAERAIDDLVASRFSRDHIHLSERDEAGHPSHADDEASFGSAIRTFFKEIFGAVSHGDADLYSEAVMRGHYVLTVEVFDDDQVHRATEALERHGVVDIEERAEVWKGGRPAAAAPLRDALTVDKDMPGRGGVRVFRRAVVETLAQDGAHARAERGAVAQAGEPAGAGGRDEASPRSPDGTGDDACYRQHWSSIYAASGVRYEECLPAYRYGAECGARDPYKLRRWDDIEPEVRNGWEAKYSGSAWEQVRDAVRHGWEKVSN